MENKNRKKSGGSNFTLEGDTLVANWAPVRPARIYAKANHLLLGDFLSPQELRELWNYTLGSENELRPSKVYKPDVRDGRVDRDYRRSRILNAPPSFEALFAEKIRAQLPLIFEKLEMKPFPIDHIDAQITATNDGEFFKPHTDNGSAPQRRRKISYVFYFYQEPKSYSGGTLRLYERPEGNESPASRKSYKVITPKQNCIVFFNSGALHEVAPVRCPSRLFSASRFTLNGWIYK